LAGWSMVWSAFWLVVGGGLLASLLAAMVVEGG
jgi:hypothetical protein